MRSIRRAELQAVMDRVTRRKADWNEAEVNAAIFKLFDDRELRRQVIHPDEETWAAVASADGQMNPSAGAAVAGQLQGHRCAAESLSSFWCA